MAEQTLGTAIVDVGADLTKLVAAFAEAKRLRDQFDADMVAHSGGLLKLTESANQAATALEAEASRTKAEGEAAKATTAALNDEAAAHKSVAAAAKEATAALETEAQKRERIAAMIDRSIEQMNRSSVSASRAGQQVLPEVTSAEVSLPQGPLFQAFTPEQEAAYQRKSGASQKSAEALRDEAKASDDLVKRSDVLLSSIDKGYAAQTKWGNALREGKALLDAGAISEKEFANVKDAVAKGLKAAEAATKDVGEASHISGTAVRELLVVMREAARGDFTRLSGSASILAQQFGVIEAVGLPMIALFAGIAAVGGTIAAGFLEGSQRAAELANTLSITRNTAGLTATSFDEMAVSISKARGVTQEAAEDVLKGFVATGLYGKKALDDLSESAITFARLTGQSADDVVKSWSKMAEDPVKFAETLVKQYNLVTDAGTGLTANQIELARRLQESGDKMGAINAIAAGVKTGLDDQKEHVGYLTTAWRGLSGAIAGAWQNLLDWGKASSDTDPTAQVRDGIARLSAERDKLVKQGPTAGQGLFDFITGADPNSRINKIDEDLGRLGGALGRLTSAQEHMAASRAKAQQGQAATIDANNAEANTYRNMVDRTGQLADAYKALDTRRAAANANLKRNPDNPEAQRTANFYNSQYGNIRTSLRKQYEPETTKEESAAARKAAAEARKEASAEEREKRKAQALEERRQQAIGALRDEAEALDALVPLYQDQSRTLDDVNRAKAIAAKLSELKLSAESAEGKEVARLVAHNLDATAAIQDETKAREALEAIRKRMGEVTAEDAAIGTQDTSGDAGVVSAAIRAAEAASKRENAIVDAALLDGTKTLDQAQKERTAIVAREAARRAQIERDATGLRGARDKLNTDKLRADYGGTAHVTTGADIHQLDQTLGGKFKKNDDALVRRREFDNMRKDALRAYDLQLKDAKGSADKLVAAERDKQKRINAINKLEKQTERQAALSQKELLVGAAASTADSLAEITASFAGKQSAAYKAMFAVSKAFAIADSVIKIQQALASATASQPFPADLPVIAQVVALGAGIIANITSVAGNFAEGGMVRGSGSGTSDQVPINASDQEFVVNQQATLKNLPMLRDINAGRQPRLPGNDNGGGGPKVTVHNYAPGVVVEAQPGMTMNEVILVAKKVVQSDAPGVVGRDMARPNSDTSKAVTTHFEVPRRRK